MQQDIIQFEPIPLEKDQNGLYPFPSMRCGIVPYYFDGNQIIWGCVKSNRVGPTTFVPPAGTQDILLVKGDCHFSIEAGKPFPDLGLDFLQQFVGLIFRDQIYQEIIDCLIENKFEVYTEAPLVTAIHEAREEHGVDLRMDEGRDYPLLTSLFELPVRPISLQQGATTEHFWLACLNNIDGIILNNTIKTEKKIRRNFGREFYEQGCWGTLAAFKKTVQEAKNFLSPTQPNTPQQIDLVAGVLDAFEDSIKRLSNIELLIRAEHRGAGCQLFFSNSQSAQRGLRMMFNSPSSNSDISLEENKNLNFS